MAMQAGISGLSWGATGRWGGFFAVVLCAWASLFAMSADFAAQAPLSLLGSGMELFAPMFPDGLSGGLLSLTIDAICFAGPKPGDAPPIVLVGMWSLMALAMMAPTATPMLRTYSNLAAGNPGRISSEGFWALLIGFCLVWLGFAILAAAAQWALARVGALSVGGLLRSNWLAAALLAAAGLYQFSALKAACLSRCRSPLAFFLSNWKAGITGALRMGLRQGVDCLGCCWALMALAFVGGTMNLVWMGAAMVLMTIEKLPTFGRYVTAPLGAALVASAAVVAWRAATV